MKHDSSISICKGLAIILMVIGHAEAPGAISAFIYEFHMPLFFITAGYFFNLNQRIICAVRKMGAFLSHHS